MQYFAGIHQSQWQHSSSASLHYHDGAWISLLARRRSVLMARALVGDTGWLDFDSGKKANTPSGLDGRSGPSFGAPGDCSLQWWRRNATQPYACSHSQSKSQPNSQWWRNPGRHILFDHYRNLRKHHPSHNHDIDGELKQPARPLAIRSAPPSPLVKCGAGKRRRFICGSLPATGVSAACPGQGQDNWLLRVFVPST